MKNYLVLILLLFAVYNFFSIEFNPLIIVENDTSTISSYYMETEKFKYNTCKNKERADLNLLIKTSDLFTFQPFVKIFDIKWSVDVKNKANFSEVNIMPGVGFNLKFNEKVTFFTWFANLNRFLELSGFWNGFNIGAQVNIKLEDKYLSFMFKEELIPLFLFNYTTTKLYDLINIFSYLISFNCFNYINDKVNSGIYIQGKLEAEFSYFDINFLSTRLTHYLFTGFSFHPHKIFKCYIAYAMINTQIINNSGTLTANIFNIGFRTGVLFFPKWFTVQIYYMPFFYNYNNGPTHRMTHIIGASLTFKF